MGTECPFHPEYPFWHLANDGFWMIDNKDELAPSGTASGPTKKTLLDNNAVARVPDYLWLQLRNDPVLMNRLIELLLDKYWPEAGSRVQVIEATDVSVGP
jgi:predicted restriction endonuclease